MARYIGPSCRLCRAEGKRLFLKGERCKTDKCAINKKRPLPGKDLKFRPKKPTDYKVQLREKQRLRRSYGILERQFQKTFDKALRMPGKTGENLFALLEQRLDNVAFRLRFASSRAQARQFVLHGHILVNGKRVNIPSYSVRPGDVITVHTKFRQNKILLGAMAEYEKSGIMPWLSLNVDSFEGKLEHVPQRQEITDMIDIREQLVVELYSK